MNTTDDLRTLLNEWKVLEAAATPGPWFADGHCLMHDVHYANLDLDYRVSLLNGTDGVSVPGWCEYAADAEFIAASRTLVPRLLAAVEAVLEEHPATRLGCITHYARTDCECEPRFICATCEVTHPCRTVAAIRSALIGGDDD